MKSFWTKRKFTVKMMGHKWDVFIGTREELTNNAIAGGLDMGGQDLYGLTVPIMHHKIVNRVYFSDEIPTANKLIDTIAHEVFHMVLSYVADEETQASHAGRVTASLVKRLVPASGLK